MIGRFITFVPVASLFAASHLFAAAAAPTAPFKLPDGVKPVLEKYCFSCHDTEEQKGKVSLDNLPSLTLDARLDLLNQVVEQVYFGEMPPKKKTPPSEAERKLLVEWASKELRAHNASKLDDKLRMPEYGNVVDHTKLFSGQYKDLPGFTSDRRWLINEFIFNAKMNALLGFTGQRDIAGMKRQMVIGDNAQKGINLTNPFLLPTNSGVRYYDTTLLDGGHLLTMLTNAKECASYMIERSKKKNYIASIEKIMTPEWEHEKILLARETYLKANVEQELSALFKEKHQAMLPVFVVPKYTPPGDAIGPDGKKLKKSVFDIASPGNEELAAIWSAMQRNSANGEKDDALIAKCEREWFVFGVNDRVIQARVKFMLGYMEDLLKRTPKQNQAKAKPPVDAELAIIRTSLQKHRKQGDTYTAVITKCLNEWEEGFKQERIKAGTVTDPIINDLVEQLFTKIIERSPSAPEKTEYFTLAKSYFEKQGNEKGIEKVIQTLILRSDFVYRYEFGEGKADEHGRRMMSPRDASYALAYALTDSSPDKALAEAAKAGKLNTREDYKREVERMLKNREQYYVIDEAVEKAGGFASSFTNIPIRKVRFFREFFGYPAMLSIFKDNKRLGGSYDGANGRIVGEADMLVTHILEKDKNVFERLLTTEEFYVYHSGDNEGMKAASDHIRKLYEYFKDKDWKNFDVAKLNEHAEFLKGTPIAGVALGVASAGRQDPIKNFKTTMTSYSQRFAKGQANVAPYSAGFALASPAKTQLGREMRGPEVMKCFNVDLASWDYPVNQPAKMPNRKGILTHPAWLIAFAANTATDPVRRGKWVREKLLAGTILDVPVTVDAVVPEDHEKTLRVRLAKVSEAEYCWKCHERMNPLGYTFEMYDDFGRYRSEESLEHPQNLVKKMPDKGAIDADLRDIYKTQPVDARGKLVGTGDPKLDGDVKDALDLIERLGKSARVRQSIIRHAFRFFMGRNEVLSDSKTLMEADQAYVQSGGSFDAVIVSLLTSDSFIYRKAQ